VYLESAQLIQLAGALLAGVVIFIAAYGAPLKVSVAILLVLIPFQPVATSYGSANVVMTYVLVGALMVRGRLRYAPMLGACLAVIFSYLISISQLPKSVYVLHGVELISLISGFLVFFLTYNLAREESNPRNIVNILAAADVLAILYCIVQFTVAPGESLELFGVKEMSLNENRGEGDARLVGPFGTPGITAAYFMSMTIILIYETVYSTGKRRFWIAGIAVTNVAMMIATANRGSFLVLVASVLGFLYLFRAQLGLARILQTLAVSTIALVGASVLIIAYTDFGQMFDRLQKTTETEDGLPATRAVTWPIALENIKEKPWVGHGPRLVLQHEMRFRELPEEQLVSRYPHNLVLHLLVTVGVIGTVTMMYFLISGLWRIYIGSKRGRFVSQYEAGLVVVGLLVVIGILVDELKIEFLRSSTVDYAHFVFALYGIFMGWADRGRFSTQPKTLDDYRERAMDASGEEIVAAPAVQQNSEYSN
jgi:O-antigen ligase